MHPYNFSIGILTWRSYQTLVNTLESYKNSGLFELANDVCILAQEATETDQQIARFYGVDLIPSKNNIGIGRGLSTLATAALTDNILLLENDWVILEEFFPTVQEEIEKGLYMINNKKADAVKYRSRTKFGDPLYTLQFAGNEMQSPKHLIECVHWRENPDLDFPGYINKDIDTGMYYADSKYANQTNNPCLYKKEFYLDNIAPFSGEGVDLEGKIDGWWQEQRFTVAQGEGLFTHYRIDR